MTDRRLRTVKKMCEETGSSRSFIYTLLKAGAIRRYKIQDVLYISLVEFEALARPVQSGEKVNVI